MIRKFSFEITNINANMRDKIFKTNMVVNFISKFVSICLNYMLVPLTINYLNQEIYGIWITLLSILSWFSFLDIGLGNGLRNKLTECLSKGDNHNARIYLSTAYITISIIITIILIPLLIIIPYMNWNIIFNISSINTNELLRLIYVTIIFFLINFILSLINQIFYAYQKAMIVGLIQVIINLLSLTGIIILNQFSKKSIIYMAYVYGLSTFFTYLFFSIIFFSNNKEISPCIKKFSKEKVNDILSLGIKFFIVQIAALVIFATDNILITQIVGPKNVTYYNIIQKLFGILTMMHSILITPLWSAYTEAYVKNDYYWIKKVLKKLNLLMIPIMMLAIGIYFSSDIIIKLWLGQSISIPKKLIILVGIYSIISIWNNIYSFFLNGTGHLKLSFLISIIITILNIPLAIYLGKYLALGVIGIVLSNIICLLPGLIIQPIQSYIILNHKYLKNKLFYK